MAQGKTAQVGFPIAVVAAVILPRSVNGGLRDAILGPLDPRPLAPLDGLGGELDVNSLPGDRVAGRAFCGLGGVIGVYAIRRVPHAIYGASFLWYEKAHAG